MNYWIFQVNPKKYNITKALQQGALETFAVTTHKNRIKRGDKVILWQTGKQAGCVALCLITSDVGEMGQSEKEKTYYIDNTDLPKLMTRVRLKVEYNLWDKPITTSMLYSKAFEKFNTGLPGTNYVASQSQYERLVEIVQMYDAVYDIVPTYETRKKEQKPLNLILFGPPGTGKTYNTINHAISIIEGKSVVEVEIENQQYRQVLKDRYEQYRKAGQIEFVTFHQAMSYEDFVEGIKPKAADKQVYYELEDGIFKQMCERASQALQQTCERYTKEIPNIIPEEWIQESEKFILIIDEINRGNIAGIFGELITLIEQDKRKGRDEATFVVLPYSKSSFIVPPNLYLIGTMNTADRSVENLDSALRRRFSFVEMPPNPRLLHRKIGEIDLRLLLETLNQRIEILLDKDHCIGHAYFMSIQTLEELRVVFANKVIPLLQEYFFNDWAKIGLILGEAFIQTKSISQRQRFANFQYEYRDDFEHKVIYELTPVQEWDETAFLGIFNN